MSTKKGPYLNKSKKTWIKRSVQFNNNTVKGPYLNKSKKTWKKRVQVNNNTVEGKTTVNNNTVEGKITVLQNSIVELLYPFGEFHNNKPFYLFDNTDFTEYFDKDEYHKFLDFTNESIKEFKRSQAGIATFKYKPDELTVDDISDLEKKVETYSQYVNKDYHSHTMKESIRKKRDIKNDTDFYFETKSDDKIIEMIKERLSNLEQCAKKPGKSENDKKYFLTEADRLKTIFEDKPDITLGELSDKIIWSTVSMFEPVLASNSNLNVNKKVQHPDKIIEEFNKDENEKYVWQLMTYIPLEYFTKNEDGRWKLISEKMKKFLTESYQEDNIQQMILGFTTDLSMEWFKQFRQLAHCYSFQWDTFNNCYLVDWSAKLNFLMIYMFSKSLKKVFPIRFKMPKVAFAYNKNNDVYSFKKSYNLKPSILFNTKPSIKIIGLTILNTKYNSKLSNINPRKNEYIHQNSVRGPGNNRIFIILHFKIDIESPDTLPIEVQLISVDHITGKSLKYVNTNIFLSQIGYGLFSYQGFTHQELMILTKYYKLHSYIIGDDKDNLFFTSRNPSNDELKTLITELNMKKVEVVEVVEKNKKSVPRDRYKIEIIK
jgi:hypothetical protein